MYMYDDIYTPDIIQVDIRVLMEIITENGYIKDIEVCSNRCNS